jgi:hypothetical protein
MCAEGNSTNGSQWLSALLAAGLLALSQQASADFSSSGATLVSAPVAGQNLTEDSQEPSVSANADIVAFASKSENLVAAGLDTNKAGDAFVSASSKSVEVVSQRQRPTGSKDPMPAANGQSSFPAISPRLPDGGYGIAFDSKAPDIINNYVSPPGSTIGNPSQIYLRLYPSNRNILVSRSIDQSGASLKGADRNSYFPVVSVVPGDVPKYKVAFLSEASDLANSAGTSSAPYLATVYFDRGEEVVEIEALPSPPDAPCSDLTMSGDGRIVAFASYATNLVTAPSMSQQVYQWIPVPLRGESELSLISATSTGTPGNGNSYGPSLSYLGDVRTFITEASNLISNATPNRSVIALSRSTKTSITQVNTYSNGSPSTQSAEVARLSPSGLYVAFPERSNLASNSTTLHDWQQVYLKDLTSGTLTIVSATKDGSIGSGGNSGEQSSSGEISRGALALGGAGFNSTSLVVLFNSRAPNLSSLLGGFQGVFRANLTASPPLLSDGLKLSTPPDVVVRGKKVTIKLQKFKLPANSSEASPLASNVSYRVTTRSAGTNYRTITTTTRNQVTMANLSPGRYTVSYRVTGGRGSNRATSTTSPKNTFTIK